MVVGCVVWVLCVNRSRSSSCKTVCNTLRVAPQVMRARDIFDFCILSLG